MSEVLFIAGTIPFILAGAAHAVCALIDTRRPTFFRPVDAAALAAIEKTGIQLRAMLPGERSESPSFWRATVGFNISHGVGAAIFGALLLLVALNDFDLVERVDALQPLSVGVGLGYFWLSLRFWFYGPAILTGIGTACSTAAVLA